MVRNEKIVPTSNKLGDVNKQETSEPTATGEAQNEGAENEEDGNWVHEVLGISEQRAEELVEELNEKGRAKFEAQNGKISSADMAGVALSITNKPEELVFLGFVTGIHEGQKRATSGLAVILGQF